MPYNLDNVKILVVDDMKPMLLLTESLLRIFGFREIYTAGDGEQGFEMFCKHSPDLVITDWIMEPVDGLELIRRIRKDHASPNKYVPVLLMTGYSSRMRVESARDHGITEFMVKPFSARDLSLRIEHVIEKPRQFVDCSSFFGPDRQRRRGDEYKGPKRREVDSKRDRRPQTGEEAAMAETLRKLAEDTRKSTK